MSLCWFLLTHNANVILVVPPFKCLKAMHNFAFGIYDICLVNGFKRLHEMIIIKSKGSIKIFVFHADDYSNSNRRREKRSKDFTSADWTQELSSIL